MLRVNTISRQNWCSVVNTVPTSQRLWRKQSAVSHTTTIPKCFYYEVDTCFSLSKVIQPGKEIGRFHLEGYMSCGIELQLSYLLGTVFLENSGVDYETVVDNSVTVANILWCCAVWGNLVGSGLLTLNMICHPPMITILIHGNHTYILRNLHLKLLVQTTIIRSMVLHIYLIHKSIIHVLNSFWTDPSMQLM